MRVEFADIVNLVGIGVGVLVSAVGFYFANNYARQTRARLADARRSAYAALWEVTGLAAPTRLETGGVGGVLSRHERDRLYQLTTDWYYRDGNGLLLGEPTRTVYLRAKANLVCPDDGLVPHGVLRHFPAGMTREEQRGCLAIRQLSLLRTQMKADLGIYGVPYVGQLSRHEREFLAYCGVNLRNEPWKAAARTVAEPERCGELEAER